MSPLQSLTAAGCRAPLGHGASHGVSFPTALAIAEAHCPGFASPGTLRLQGSLALVTPCFSRDLHGRVSCRARSWVSALRSFPLRREGPSLSTRSCPPAVGSCGRALPRPPSPGSWVLLPPEVRFAAARRSWQLDRCSLGLHLSRDFLPAATAAGFPAPSSRGLDPLACEARRPPLGVSIAPGPVRLRGDHRPS